MPDARVVLVRAAGTNCDREAAHAFELAGATVEVVHINALKRDAGAIDRADIACFPGGFSYGDDVASGRILANEVRHSLGAPLRELHARGGLMLGICNGFQVLVKSGLLPGGVGTDAPPGEASATLVWNANHRFEARWIRVRVDAASNCVFLRGLTALDLPIAHAEGRFVARDTETMNALAASGQTALRYTARFSDDASHPLDGALAYPDNPNGSQANVAGVCDPTGRIFGLMPHPERFVVETQHPQWTRARAADSPIEPAGLRVFQNAVAYVREPAAV